MSVKDAVLPMNISAQKYSAGPVFQKLLDIHVADKVRHAVEARVLD